MSADRLTSPMGDRRERAVHCEVCRINTYNIGRICNRCLDKQEKENK